MSEDPDLRPAVCAAVACEEPGLAPAEVVIIETHISLVFLTARYAYKLKKARKLDFLDYSTPERRRRMCEEEVRLNRRLAPRVYLDVRALVAADGLRLAPMSDAPAIDYVVRMTRFALADTLAGRIEAGTATAQDAAVVGDRLARFHLDSVLVPPRPEDALRGLGRFRANLGQLLMLAEDDDARARLIDLGLFGETFSARHRAEFGARAAAGLICDGHADLRAEHVVLAPELAIVDCVEFDPGLRRLDPADDLAFLTMDLEHHGRRDLADALISAYRAAGGDPGSEQLRAFYGAHHALVRAKVALLGSGTAARRQHDATALIARAEHLAWRARGPIALVLCGVAASGKSTLAAAVAGASGAEVLSSDVIRKAETGVALTDRAPLAAYAGHQDARTYTLLGTRVSPDRTVVVDATFRLARDRRAFRLALDRAARVRYVECRAPVAVLGRRARERMQDARRVSDACPAVAALTSRQWETLDEVPQQQRLTLWTDCAIEDQLSQLTRWLDARPDAAETASTCADRARVAR